MVGLLCAEWSVLCSFEYALRIWILLYALTMITYRVYPLSSVLITGLEIVHVYEGCTLKTYISDGPKKRLSARYYGIPL